MSDDLPTASHAAAADPKSSSWRSRRAVLTGVLGAAGAWAAGAVARVAPADASAGSNLIIGSQTNDAGSANTQLQTASNAVAFKLLQNAPNTALMGYVTTTTNTGGPRGVYGRSDAPNGDGVQGRNAGAVGTGAGMRAFGGVNTGLIATTTGGSSAIGVDGTAVNGIGVRGTATSNGYGVRGTGGYNGVYGSGGSYGLIGSAGAGYGVYGSGTTGVYASGGTGGYGVQAYGGTYGVYGDGATYGVYGDGPTGVFGNSGSGNGVYGSTANINAAAVYGNGGQYGVQGGNARTAGVRGDSGYVGVWGEGASWGFYSIATATSGQNYGIMSETMSKTTGYAGWFKGNVQIEGTIFKSAGSFKIDHPLDPDRRWLSHSFVESPDMMNVYNGTVVLDAGGRATIPLPDYFEALNRDFRYQLTPIGAAAPSLHVARKVKRNEFQIAGGSAGQEVSWQITGIRQDAYANEHRIEVDTLKSTADQGTRLFVAKGSGARKMEVGPRRPTDVPPGPAMGGPGAKPADVQPRPPAD